MKEISLTEKEMVFLVLLYFHGVRVFIFDSLLVKFAVSVNIPVAC